MRFVVVLLVLPAFLLAACGAERSSPKGPALAALREALADPDRGVRYAAVEALGKAGANPSALAPALDDEVWCVRREAGWWLARSGATALPVLEAALADGSPETRATAARALDGLEALGVPALRRALDDAEREVRCEALVATRRLGAEHGAALVDAVEQHLYATEADEQAEAALALVAIAPENADAALPILAREMRAPKWLDHYEAIEALLHGGEACRAELAEIEHELPENENNRSRIRWSREAWEREQEQIASPAPPATALPAAEVLPPRPALPPSDVPALLRALQDPERDTRIEAANALGEVDPWGPEVEPALRRALADDNWRVRRAAVLALGKHGVAADQIAPFLADPILPLSYAAADAIAHCGAAAAQPLADQVATGHYGVLHYAPLVFTKLGAEGAPAVATLQGLLTHADVNVRECAARCLRAIGPPALPAAPALVEALDDERVCVVAHAALALGAIGDAEVLLPP